MKPSHRRRLAAIQEDLIEVLIVELDPRNWPGHGLKPIEMTKDERGDRYWCKKDASATLVLVNHIERMNVGEITGSNSIDDQEALVRKAEREAELLVARAMERYGA